MPSYDTVFFDTIEKKQFNYVSNTNKKQVTKQLNVRMHAHYEQHK